ncbi:MAG: ubiquinone/menaquinone biosynthesis methyltransferase [Actinomycetota bacterium]
MSNTDRELDGSVLPTGEEKARQVRQMFDDIAPRYDLVNRVMTFRLDTRWRRRAVLDLQLPPGSTVLDLACGTGDLCDDLRAGGHVPIGMDFSFGMLSNARTSEPLAQADALGLPVPDGGVDGVICGFALRNFTDLSAFFAECARVIRPRGRVALLDAAEPENRVLRFGHGIYFGTVVPRIGATLSKASAYRYLPKSLAYLPEGPELTAMLRDAGFPDAERRLLFGGAAQLLTGTRS